MMKHIVMFKFQAEANGKTAMENAAAAKEKAEQLPAQIPQLKKLEVRLNSPSADPTNYEFALICEFDGRPEHLSGTSGTCCFWTVYQAASGSTGMH